MTHGWMPLTGPITWRLGRKWGSTLSPGSRIGGQVEAERQRKATAEASTIDLSMTILLGMAFPAPQAADEDAHDGGDAHPVKRVRVNSSNYWDNGALSSADVMEFAEKVHAEKEARDKAKADRQTKREEQQAQRHEEALKCNAEAMALVGGGADVKSLSVKNLQAILLARCLKPKGKKADLVE